MSIRSLLTFGALVAPAFALPGGKEKTVTVTKTEKVTHTEKITYTKSAKCPATSVKATTPSVYKPSTTTTKAPSTYGGSSSSSSSVVTTTSSSASNTNPSTTIKATATATNYGLNDAAKAIGKLWFGTAIDYPGTGEGEDPYYLGEFNNTHDFGEATPANIMKFEQTEPEQGVFNFTGGDAFLDLAEASGKLVRCHNLIWQSELPTWVTNPTVNWTNATLVPVLQNHVTSLIEYWGDRCYSWDVVNEALSDSPAGAFQSNIWYDTIGSEYVALAFAAATEAVQKNSLKVKLYYNDYNIEYPGNKSTAAQNIVKDLKSRGIQIDGVGLESHYIVGETPSQADQTANKKAFTALDVDVAVTELDVRLTLPATAATETQQVADYYSSVASCVEVDRCIGVTVWDFDDTYSWIPSTFAGQGYGDLFLQPNGANTELVKKAAYDGCLEALTGAAEAV